MARQIICEPSRTLAEFRLLPGLTSLDTTIDKISLQSPLVCPQMGQRPIFLNLPFVAAAMQSVSGVRMGIALAKLGGAAFLYCSQPIESQADMVSQIKSYKGGFVQPQTVGPDTTIRELDELSRSTGFHNYPVVDPDGTLLGLITHRDYDVRHHGQLLVTRRMVPRNRLEVGIEVTALEQANAILLDSHQSVLPVVDRDDRLQYLVFKKDIYHHLHNPLEVVDGSKRLLAVAAINTHDYETRVPALVAAEVDAVAIDSSDGHSHFQRQTLEWIRQRYPDLPVIGGNIITGEGFDYLVEAGAWAVKVGMGSGSICITQEQKGTGRGLATAIIEVARARDRYLAETGRLIPIIADGGIVNAKDVVVALALGADYVMMGRFFARMEEAPGDKLVIGNRVVKTYWGEGSPRARAWRESRYQQAAFAEGVEGFVEYAGHLSDNVDQWVAKIKAAMSSCGVSTIQQLHKNAVLEVVSPMANLEGQVHHVLLPGDEPRYRVEKWGD